MQDLLSSGSEAGLRTARPNAAHKAVAEMERLGHVHCVVTQNVDGLHQEAGSERVVEVHGTMATCSCIETGQQVEQQEVLQQWSKFVQENPEKTIQNDRWVPHHPETGGILKANVTFFGEALPTGAFSQAAQEVLASSVVLVIGTSLNVMPAGLLPSMMKLRLGNVIIVNFDTSGIDGASLHIRGKAGEVVPEILTELKRLMITTLQ